MMIRCVIEYILIWVGLNVCEDWHGLPVKSAPLLWSNIIMLNYFLIIYIEQKGKDE